MDCLLVICPLCFHTVVLIGAIYGIYLVSIFPLYDENNLVYLIPMCVLDFCSCRRIQEESTLRGFFWLTLSEVSIYSWLAKGSAIAWELFTSWWPGAVWEREKKPGSQYCLQGYILHELTSFHLVSLPKDSVISQWCHRLRIKPLVYVIWDM